MACPDAPGPCTKTPDGACTAPKTEGVLPPIVATTLIKNNGDATISWETDTSYPDQVVRCMDSKVGTGPTERTIVNRDVGEYTTTNSYMNGDDFFIYLRPETDAEYGEWQLFTADFTFIGLDFSNKFNSQYLGVI